MKLILYGKPNIKQEQFFYSLARHTAYGGARGGGKSWAMRRKFVLLALNYEGLNLLLLRRTLPELRENHTLHLLAELKDICKYTERDRAFNFPNGSRLRLGYCDSETDVLQYQGQEYDVVGLEEATHFTEYQRNFLTTCNRSTRTDFTPRMYYTANPGGVGHAWFKRLFVDKNYRGSENKADYNFIPARIYDNPQLMQNNPEYLDNLKALPDELRRAHLDGDWNVYSGQFFPEFRAEIHTTRPFKIPHHWRRFASLDYGMDMTACLFYAVSDDQEVYIYKEVYEQGLTLSQAAEKIQEYIAENEQIDYITASPDLWNSRQESGISGNQIMANAGLRGLIRANDNRIAGWRIVREYLNKPNKFKIFSNCINLIRCLPQLRYDKIRIEDAANNPHEVTHAPESLRYGLCSIPIKTKLDAIKSGFYTETEKEDFWQQKGFQIRKI